MKKRLGAVGLCWLLAGAPAWAWEFNTEGDREGWTSGQHLKSNVAQDGKLVITVNAGATDPFVVGPAGPFNGDIITGVEFRIRFSMEITSTAGAAMYFFPSAGSHGSFDYGMHLTDPLDWNIVYIDFLGQPKGGDSPSDWFGEINNIRLDFIQNLSEEYTVEIDWIRFVDEWIQNNVFEFGSLEPWGLEGEGTIDAFQVTEEQSFGGLGSVAVTGLGSDRYHALSQEIANGLTLKKGQLVSVVGAVKVPRDSWDANSTLWFRIREFDGTNENLSPVTEVSVFDEWFQFQSQLALAYEPAQRRELKVQLYSKNPAGKVFYFDDIFVNVQPAPQPVIENPGWPVNAVKLAPGQTITIDGNVSAAEYAGAQALVMNADTYKGIPDPYFPQYNHNGALLTAGMAAATPLSDFNATYYFMWDDQFFYAAVSAVDDHYSFVGPDPNGSDTLQFVFAETPDELQTANMYIPTIAPEGPDGNIVAKNDFGGWLAVDIMGESTFAGKVDPNTSDWAVEIKIPWSAMNGFSKPVFPPKTGDRVGFVVLAIDYDNGTLEWFSCNESTFPWNGEGVERMYFIELGTGLDGWPLY
ncbi:MAG: hypothetical protein HPY51_13110 [Candidatus Omnitrophica bacterium]|nr:hypothetical protein [Candidatus Omnitrophota bacterium]